MKYFCHFSFTYSDDWLRKNHSHLQLLPSPQTVQLKLSDLFIASYTLQHCQKDLKYQEIDEKRPALEVTMLGSFFVPIVIICSLCKQPFLAGETLNFAGAF